MESGCERLLVFGDGSSGLLFVRLALECLALVPDVLTPAQAELDLHFPAAQVGAARVDGQALGFGGLGQALDLALVDQQLALATRRVVVPVGPSRASFFLRSVMSIEKRFRNVAEADS